MSIEVLVEVSESRCDGGEADEAVRIKNKLPRGGEYVEAVGEHAPSSWTRPCHIPFRSRQGQHPGPHTQGGAEEVQRGELHPDQAHHHVPPDAQEE